MYSFIFQSGLHTCHTDRITLAIIGGIRVPRPRSHCKLRMGIGLGVRSFPSSLSFRYLGLSNGLPNVHYHSGSRISAFNRLAH